MTRRVHSRMKLLQVALSGLVVLLLSMRPADAVEVGDTETPLLLTADEMTYDRELGIVTASGSVEVSQADRILLADTISYNQRQDVMTASGNITLLEPSGEVVFAEYMELTGDLRDGILRDIRILLSDRSRLAANGARRSGGTVTEMRRAVYSACNLCEDDPSRPPLWQVKAVKVVHDRDRRTVEYEDAWLEMAGVPALYTPYFSHPDPTVKRKTGFLVPSIGNSSDLGFILRVPYFFALAPNKDLTVTPTITTEERLVLAAEYRHLFENGKMNLEGSATYNSDNEFRGHIDGSLRFDIDDTWRWGLDAQRTSDDTYLRRYGFGSPKTMTSRVFAEGFRERNYAAVNAYAFQGLSETDDPGETPLVLPMLDFNHVGQPDKLGGRTNLDVNMVALTRTDGRDTQRLSVGAGWQLPYVGPIGDVYTLNASLRGDLYHVNGHQISGEPDSYSGVKGRIHPEASLTWRYPLVRNSPNVQQTLEPIVMAVVSPYGGNPATIPNEDSLDFEFDDTNLFSSDRFVGLDRVEGGPRVNYGLKWGVYGRDGGSTTLLFGQSYRLRDDDTFATDSGLEDNFSDFVGRIHIAPSSNVNFHYRTRLDKDNFIAQRNEVDLRLGSEPVSLDLGYVFFSDQGGDEFPGREEISATLQARLTRYWRGQTWVVRDLKEDTGGLRRVGLRMTYEDECFVFTTNFERTFFEDRDLKPTDSIILRLMFKTLGEISTAVQ